MPKASFLRFVALLPCMLVLGCSATVTHQAEKTNATGVRYYAAMAPYLLVYSDGKGSLKWQIYYLPDQSRIMTATPKILGGHTEMTLTFQNGVMANGSTLGDTTDLAKATIATVQSAIPLLAKAAFEGPDVQGFPPPCLYKIIVEDGSVTFLGGKGNTRIQVPINGAS